MSAGRLLVMDDEPRFGAFVEEVARDLSYDVRVLCNPTEFKDVYAEFVPDTIVLDMVMPEFDGTEITRWLSTQKFAGKLLIVTGYNPQYSKIAKTLGELGGLTHVERLSKPLRLEELRRALRA